jgi:peptidoglycan endopeptidase LytE
MPKKQWLAMAAGSAFAMSSLTVTAFAAANTYVVKPGDTFYKIARATHQPYTVLQAINTPNGSLHPGQVLHLATPHVVKPGETVWKIARMYGLNEADIVRWNHLANPNVIYAGRTLWLDLSRAHTSRTRTGAARLSGGSSQPEAPRAAAPAKPEVTGSDVAAYARQFVGAPYQWGGTSSAGFDCSGLVYTVYAHFGIMLPRKAADQHAVGTPVSKSNLKPGDLVFFNTNGSAYSHVGIYLGNGKFISATTSHGVTISDLDNPYYWGPRYTGAVDPLA